MYIMYMLLAIFALIMGFLSIKYPKKMLEIGHIFTVKSGTEFTEFAIGKTIFGGVIAFFGGIILFIYAIASL